MKLFRLTMIFVLAITALGLGTMPASAQVGRFTYMSSILVQNLDSTDGEITLTFYEADGGTAATLTEAILANSQNSYFPLPASVGDTFNGSVIITSTTNVASISNVHGGQGSNAFFASGAYVAQSAGATTVSIPLLMKGNGQYNTWFNVQNAGSGDATVTVKYSDVAAAETAVTIAKGAAKTFNQATETQHTTAIFAATVTSDQPIVITVIEESASILYAYNGFAAEAGSTAPVFPLFHANNSGYFTAINLQNQGTDSTTVTISYTAGTNGTDCTETQTIAPGKNGIFGFPFAAAPGAGVTSTCVLGQRFIGSAQVTDNTSDNNLVAVVNQWNGSINGGAYNGFNADAATGKIVLPLVFDRRAGYWTSAGIRNVGTVATTVTCTFTPPSGSTTPVTWTSDTLDPDEGVTHFHYELVAENYLGSATCVANTSGAKIIAIVNELGASASTDELLVYEAINVTP